MTSARKGAKTMCDGNQARILERLLAQLADEGAPGEVTRQIEELLIDDEQLQDLYWQWMDAHVVLGVESGALLGDNQARGESAQRLQPAQAVLMRTSDGVISARQKRGLQIAAGAVAACLAWVVVSGVGLRTDQEALTLPLAAEGRSWRIPQITRVSWQGPFFSNSIAEDLVAAEVRPGRVTLQLASGAAVNGYLLQLDRGESAELTIAADAYTENNFSVTELNSQGAPIRRSVSFNNYSESTTRGWGWRVLRGVRQNGLLGTWSVSNDADRPKYFLLAGVHQIVDPGGASGDQERPWRMSEMSTIVEEPDFVLLGWDDGGIEATKTAGAIAADGDFDDMTVLLRISSADAGVDRPQLKRRIVGVAAATGGMPQSDRALKYHFTVAPGEAAVLNVTCSALDGNSLFLVDDSSSEVLWSTSQQGARTSNLGGVFIENNGDKPLSLALFGEHASAGDAQWNCSEVKICHEQTGCAVLGFEDSGADRDFNDLRVTLLHLSHDRFLPIDEL